MLLAVHYRVMEHLGSLESTQEARVALGYASFVLSKLPARSIKHLMTGHKGNSEFCFPETLNVPRGEAEGSRGNKTHCFPRGQSLSVLLYLPTQK